MTLVIERNFSRRGENGGTISNVRLVADVTKVTLDGQELPDASVEYLLMFALQSLQDAYAGAKTLDEAKSMFAKKYDKLIEGKIGIRESGESISDEVRIGRKIMRQIIREKSPEQYKKLREMDEDAQIAALDKNIAKNAEHIAKLVADEMRRIAEEKKQRALLGKEVSFEL